jgi:putative salt-induced outer membrane protein
MQSLVQSLSVGIALFLLTPVVFADQITMQDGDRITGEIVKKDGDTLTVKSKNFGTVTLKWSDVATVKTDQPINLALPGGKTVKANIETQNGQIQAGSRVVAPKDVVTLRNDAEQKVYERYLHPGFLDLWTVTGSLNIAGAKGNAQTTTLTTPFNFVRASNTTRTTAYFNAIRSTATVNGVNAQTAQAVRGGWGYSRNVTQKIFGNAFNDYEYDKFQSLDLRVVIGGGAGYLVWSHDANRLSAVGGIDWNREAFGPANTASFTRNSAEAYWGNDFNYKLNTRTTLVEGFRMFNNLSNGGEYRVNFDVGATTQVAKWLNWTIALSDRYLSDPVPGRKNSDFLYSTGLGFSWARQ